MNVRSLVLSSCGLGLAALLVVGAAPARAEGGGIQVKKSDKLGSYLADAKGSTLYVFKKDSPGKSACTGECVAKWPIFHADQVSPPPGVDAKDFSTVQRDDGHAQTAYKGMPLYYFAGDKAPGETNGQGVRDVWHVATP